LRRGGHFAYRWIIFGKDNFGWRFLLASKISLAWSLREILGILLPWSLRAVRGNKQPCAPQWIVSAMRDIVQDLVGHLDAWKKRYCTVRVVVSTVNGGEDRRWNSFRRIVVRFDVLVGIGGWWGKSVCRRWFFAPAIAVGVHCSEIDAASFMSGALQHSKDF
jgi:hypothetical protein